MNGFTLIETIISLGLVVIVTIIFISALSTLPLTKNTRNENIAYHVAAKKLEELRNTPFASLPVSGTFVDAGLVALASSTAQFSITNYQSSNQIKQVVVTVSWLEQLTTKSAVLETLISQYGLNQP